jgi:phosphatidylglycerol:prolipoprotein diacylglycerol transferase
VYPYWLEIGSFKLPTFGPMVVAGFLAAHFVIKRELVRRGIGEELATNLITAAILGGLAGAKLYFVTFELPPGATWETLLRSLFSGSGLTWHGGFLVATGAVMWTIARHGAPLAHTADAIGPGLAIGYAIGRIGCQLAGDGDYGVPTDLPWGMAYPDGVVPTTEIVHPAPVYETLLGLAIFALLWRLREPLAQRRPGLLFCLYLVLAGAARFSVETIRLNPEVLFGLTGAQLFSLGLMTVGVVLGLRLWTTATDPTKEPDPTGE